MLLNSSHIAACLLSHGWVCNPWTVARHTALSMEFSGKYTGVGCHFLLHQIFQTQGLNSPFLRLQHWQADCLPQSHQRNSYYFPSNPCLTLKAIYENIISECVTPTTHYTSFKYSHYFQPWTHSLTPFFFYSGLLCSFSHWQYFGNILLLKHAPFPGGFFSYPIKLIFSFSESSVFQRKLCWTYRSFQFPLNASVHNQHISPDEFSRVLISPVFVSMKQSVYQNKIRATLWERKIMTWSQHCVDPVLALYFNHFLPDLAETQWINEYCLNTWASISKICRLS